MLEEGVGPVVHDTGDQSLHVAELTVNTQNWNQVILKDDSCDCKKSW